MTDARKITVTLEIDGAMLRSYTDQHLATLWHVAMANPAAHDDQAAGEVTERLAREIVRRWLGQVEPDLWSHQARTYYRTQLARFARYEPGGAPGSAEWHEGTWVAKEREGHCG